MLGTNGGPGGGEPTPEETMAKILMPLVVAITAGLAAGNSFAETLIDNGTSTTDAATGLTWLDLTETQDADGNPMSLSYVKSQLGPGGLFEGYRMATANEVHTFMGDADVQHSTTTGPTSFTAEDVAAGIAWTALVGETLVANYGPYYFGSRGYVELDESIDPLGLDLLLGYYLEGPGGPISGWSQWTNDYCLPDNNCLRFRIPGAGWWLVSADSQSATLVITTTLVSGPQQLDGGTLVDVPHPTGGTLASGQILVGHNQSQFYSFEILIANNSGQTVSRVFSGAISEIFDLSEGGEDASDGMIDEVCTDGTCDGIKLDGGDLACTVRALYPKDIDKALVDVLAAKTMLVIVCDDLVDGDTATIAVWVETEKKKREEKYKPTACLKLANDSATPVNEWLALNPGIKEYASDGNLLHGPVQSIQLQPVSVLGCKVAAD
jgi:hypothetical protein